MNTFLSFYGKMCFILENLEVRRKYVKKDLLKMSIINGPSSPSPLSAISYVSVIFPRKHSVRFLSCFDGKKCLWTRLFNINWRFFMYCVRLTGLLSKKNENLSMFSQYVKQWIDIIYATKQKLTDRYELEISKYNWTGAWWTGGVKSPF